MEEIIKVSLTGMEFFAFHGLYDHEKEKGNFFEVNVTVGFKAAIEELLSDDIHKTVDYESVYNTVEEIVNVRVQLLETLAAKIAITLLENISRITEVEVSVVKRNPPVAGKCKESKVTIQRKR
ncbi:MAG: dihydroneopterin aldolase [Cytophagaceae bacterium]